MLTRRPVARLSESRVALLLVLPTLVILIGLALFPLAWAGVLSFRVENLFNPKIGHWVGFRNFETLLGDSVFWKSMRLTLVWSAVVVPIQLVLGFVFALLLDTKMRGIGLLRTLIVIPVFISPIAMGLTWRFMFEPVTGVVNYTLESVGLPGGAWHTSTDSALVAVMIADTWQWTPFVTLILLAGMQNISPEVIEAARLDRDSFFAVHAGRCNCGTLFLDVPISEVDRYARRYDHHIRWFRFAVCRLAVARFPT